VIADLVARSLELVADRCGDPAPLVYARLFAAHPEMEAQFVMDRTGAVRGEMLAIALETLIDLAEDKRSAPAMIRAELVNHDGWGVPADVFATFYRRVAETCRDALGADWTAETDAAWSELLTRVDRLIVEQTTLSRLPLTGPPG
jgi:hemoglobin-like flavoprotein